MEFKILVNAENLKLWQQPHKRHTQEGPDVLKISESKKILNFKTTFMPGGEVGRLHCIIAGELATFEGLDITPEDWSALSDFLTTRNTTKLRKQSNIQAFVKKTLKSQKAESNKKRLAYEKTGDHKIVMNYIMDDYSGETMKESWVMDVLATWHREGRKDLLHKLAHPDGHPRALYPEILQNLIFVDRIDRYKQDGNLSAAIITEMQRESGNEKIEIKDKDFFKIKNRYETYKNTPILCRAVEGPDYYELILYGSKITQGEQPLARGTLKYRFFKK